MEGFLVVLVISVGVGAAGIAWARKKERARKALWQGIATKRGGTCGEYRKSWFSRSWGIDVEVGDARVFLDTYIVDKVTFTRARARYPVLAGATYRVYRESVMSSLGKALGTQDVVLGGDDEFDAAFMVKCNDPDVVRSVWTPDAKALMRGILGDCWVESGQREVKLAGTGVWMDEAKIDAALDLLGVLTRGEQFGTAALEALPEAEYHPPGGSWDEREPPCCHVELRATRVTLEPVADASLARTRASAHATGLPRPLDVTLDQDADLSEVLSHLDVVPRVGLLTGSRLRWDGELVTLDWPGIEHDVDGLQAGAELVAHVAVAPRKGVFR